MLKSIRWSAWSLIVLVLLPVGLAAQGGFIYTNNDTTPNSISAYGFDTNGGLQPVGSQPFLTGDNGSNGGFYSSNRIIVVGDFLYASNSGNAGGITTVSAFTIDAGSGFLTRVPGSPFSTGAFNDTQNSGVSLAATPDGKFLFVGSTGIDSQFNVGSIAIFSIDPTTGALTATSKSPVAAGGPMSSMKVSPDGKFLVAALPNSSAIAVFAIHGPGSLHEVHNSPYVLSSITGPANSVDFNCAGNLLFAGGNKAYIYVFNFASGKLTPVAGSPFPTGTTSNKAVALSTDDSTLFASDPDNGIVTAFTADANGVLVFAGSANAAGSGGFNAVPGGLAVTNGGPFLFSADKNGDLSGDAGFSIFSLSPLPISLQLLKATVPATGFHSLAAYPPKACTGAAAAAVVHGP
jgi:WD40 repeat protein